MKKIGKLFASFALIILTITMLGSCGIYRDYDIPYNNVYEEVDFKKLAKILAAEENKATITYVMYASTSVSSSNSAVVTMNEQAKQFNIEKVYYFDASKYYNNADKRKTFKDEFDMKDPSVCPSVLTYVGNNLKVDWSRASTQSKYDDSFTKLAYYIFHELPNES